MSHLVSLEIVYKGGNGFVAEESTDRSTAQSNLLDSLPQLEWTQSLLTSPGKAAVGDGKRGLLTLLFTIPLKPILFKPTRSSCILQLIKPNTN